MRILVTDGMDKTAMAQLREAGHEVVEQFYEPDQLGAALREFDAVVVRSKTKIRANHIDEAKGGKLKLIIRGGVGVDNIDVKYAEANGITVQGIVLSGGASKMPMVKKALEEALPQFKDRIIYFRPSRAIAYGAARFGTAEVNQDPAGDTTMVQQRTVFDLGVRFYNGTDDKVGHIATYIPAGTPIPYAGEYHGSRTLHENQRYSGFEVYEAVVSNPDRNNVFEDYVQIMEVTVDHGEGGVPVGTENESRLQVDKLGVLTIQARMKTNDGMKPVESTVQLTNLSSSV